MGIFDIIGPVMVGPSSSHTAGAARIGFVARNLLGEDVKEARILLYGSFLAVMVVECDQDVPKDGLEWLEKVEGIIKVTYLKKAGGR